MDQPRAGDAHVELIGRRIERSVAGGRSHATDRRQRDQIAGDVGQRVDGVVEDRTGRSHRHVIGRRHAADDDVARGRRRDRDILRRSPSRDRPERQVGSRRRETNVPRPRHDGRKRHRTAAGLIEQDVADTRRQRPDQRRCTDRVVEIDVAVRGVGGDRRARQLQGRRGAEAGDRVQVDRRRRDQSRPVDRADAVDRDRVARRRRGAGQDHVAAGRRGQRDITSTHRRDVCPHGQVAGDRFQVDQSVARRHGGERGPTRVVHHDRAGARRDRGVGRGDRVVEIDVAVRRVGRDRRARQFEGRRVADAGDRVQVDRRRRDQSGPVDVADAVDRDRVARRRRGAGQDHVAAGRRGQRDITSTHRRDVCPHGQVAGDRFQVDQSVARRHGGERGPTRVVHHDRAGARRDRGVGRGERVVEIDVAVRRVGRDRRGGEVHRRRVADPRDRIQIDGIGRHKSRAVDRRSGVHRHRVRPTRRRDIGQRDGSRRRQRDVAIGRGNSGDERQAGSRRHGPDREAAEVIELDVARGRRPGCEDSRDVVARAVEVDVVLSMNTQVRRRDDSRRRLSDVPRRRVKPDREANRRQSFVESDVSRHHTQFDVTSCRRQTRHIGSEAAERRDRPQGEAVRIGEREPASGRRCERVHIGRGRDQRDAVCRTSRSQPEGTGGDRSRAADPSTERLQPHRGRSRRDVLRNGEVARHEADRHVVVGRRDAARRTDGADGQAVHIAVGN